MSNLPRTAEQKQQQRAGAKHQRRRRKRQPCEPYEALLRLPDANAYGFSTAAALIAQACGVEYHPIGRAKCGNVRLPVWDYDLKHAAVIGNP